MMGADLSLLNSIQDGSGTHPPSCSLDTRNPVHGDKVTNVPLVLSFRVSGAMPSWLGHGHHYPYVGSGRKLNRDLLSNMLICHW